MTVSAMGWRALGDSAWLFEPGGNTSAERSRRALEMLETLRESHLPEVTDWVGSFESVAVHFDPIDGEAVLDRLVRLPVPTGKHTLKTGRSIEIPVCYGDGENHDLDEIAQITGMSRQQVIELHHAPEYTVAAVGFSPGFPYLSGLDPRLHVPRKATPRRVAAGSVAIAGGQAGIYPFESPGGWQVLGRTSATLFDPAADQPAHLRAGDRVRFVPVASLVRKAISDPISDDLTGAIEVVSPGPFTTVQDLGRPGHQEAGVTPGGAADPVAARMVNRLVGNGDAAALLECAGGGPVLRFHRAMDIAFLGWGTTDSGKPRRMTEGSLLDLRTRMRSAIGYIAVAGGIDVPPSMGSRATDVRGRFGGFHGRPMRCGDILRTFPPIGVPPTMTTQHVAWPSMAETRCIRYLPGIQSSEFHSDALGVFKSSLYRIGTNRDRTGARLEGPLLQSKGQGEPVSRPIVRGSIQVPPDGVPIVLLSEHQTIGGYPQIGHVITADLPTLAHALPGSLFRFVEVTLDEAREAWRKQLRELALLKTGLDFLK